MKSLKCGGIVACCLAIGFVNGLLGGAGGMLCVPFLVFALKYPNKSAHATAIFVVLICSVVSCVIYIVKGFYIVSSGIYVGIGVVAGGVLGAFLLKKLSNDVVCIVFYIIMLAAGIKLLI